VKTLDRDIRETLGAAAEHAAPEGYYDDFAQQVVARLEPEEEMRGVNMSGANGAGDRSQELPPQMAGGAESRTTAEDEDSGLIDIKNMARSTKRRVTQRHSTASDVEESLLASSRPSALRDVVLPEPGKERPVALAAATATEAAADVDAFGADQPERKRGGWMFAAAAVVLLGGGAAAFFAMRGGDADDGTRIAASETPATSNTAPTPAAAADSEATPPVPPSEPGIVSMDLDEGGDADGTIAAPPVVADGTADEPAKVARRAARSDSERIANKDRSRKAAAGKAKIKASGKADSGR